MKRCPVCNKLFDGSLKFCLHDGAALLSAEVSPGLQQTLVLPEGAGRNRSYRLWLILGGLFLSIILLSLVLLLRGGIRRNLFASANANNRQTSNNNSNTVASPQERPAPIKQSPAANFSGTYRQNFNTVRIKDNGGEFGTMNFTIKAFLGQNQGEISGTARWTSERVAEYEEYIEAYQETCQLKVTFYGRSVTIEQTDGCRYYAGNNVSFEGKYRRQ
jgi:hypothetical protein